MKALVLTAALGACLSLGGCMTVGRDFDQAQVAALTPGDTREQVIARLGRPTTTVTVADGTTTMMWLFSRGNALGQGSSKGLMLRFDQDGRYVGVVSQTNTEIGLR